MSQRVEIGIVMSDKASKTRRVEIPRLVRDKKYGKYLRRKTVCYVHDEENQSHLGDVVEIVESRPRSRLKRWALVRVVEQGKMIDLAAMRAAMRAHHGKSESEEAVEEGEANP
ncbi:MAG: 30S ribosomal protein S17 [Pirellulales bacterium]|nr:30S ribosomal protein S17 [Pirellulales bacterium]